MKLYYHKTPQGNFGDDLNTWLWESALEYRFNDDPSEILVGIGTILDQRIPLQGKKYVMGSGFGYGSKPVLDENVDVRFVRGPKTAEALGLDKSLAITDPANFTSRFIPKQEKLYKYSYVPHVGGAIKADWDTICSMLGIHYIDPRQESTKVIKEISATEYLITEAMHGAIIADAFRVPWVATTVYDFILSFKWQDFCASLDMTYQPHKLTELWHPERDLSAVGKFKNTIKRIGHGIGYRPEGITPAPPRQSKPAIYQRVCEEISSIIKQAPFQHSEDRIHLLRLEQVEEKIMQLKRQLATQ